MAVPPQDDKIDHAHCWPPGDFDRAGGEQQPGDNIKKFRKIYNTLRRNSRKKSVRAGLEVTALVLLVTIVAYHYGMPAKIDPRAYAPLLSTIAKGESGGNYNAYFGHAANTTIHFTEMPVSEVLQWQEAYIAQGNPSNAVGKYQIVRPTLMGLVRQLGTQPQAHFDEALQDRMAIALLERRGSLAFVEKKITREQFAANLAQEWASLPKVTGAAPSESYYAGDGLNKSQIRIDEVYSALVALQNRASGR